MMDNEVKEQILYSSEDLNAEIKFMLISGDINLNHLVKLFSNEFTDRFNIGFKLIENEDYIKKYLSNNVIIDNDIMYLKTPDKSVCQYIRSSVNIDGSMELDAPVILSSQGQPNKQIKKIPTDVMLYNFYYYTNELTVNNDFAGFIISSIIKTTGLFAGIITNKVFLNLKYMGRFMYNLHTKFDHDTYSNVNYLIPVCDISANLFMSFGNIGNNDNSFSNCIVRYLSQRYNTSVKPISELHTEELQTIIRETFTAKLLNSLISDIPIITIKNRRYINFSNYEFYMFISEVIFIIISKFNRLTIDYNELDDIMENFIIFNSNRLEFLKKQRGLPIQQF